MRNAMNTPPTIRWQLLSTVSALALIGSACAASAATDADRPTLWIELGGQMENITGQGEIFAPAFLSVYPNASVLGPTTPLQAQRPPKFSFGEEGKISFQPVGSDWIFSAGIRIGRSSNFRHVDHQTTGVFGVGYKSGIPTTNQNFHGTNDFADTQAHHKENHTVLDFSAGKDVGLGMFGKDSSSLVSLGVRFAQFASKAAFEIRARPDLHFKYLPITAINGGLHLPHFHAYHATGHASRSFRGVGPSISWNGSTPFLGNPRDGEITFDWGVNAAILFGKQKAHVRHQETGYYQTGIGKYYNQIYQNPPAGHNTVRSVIVPNAGGFAGASWSVEDFKFSLGYRADFFFGAFDGGIDVRKNETLGFKGPFASISVGLGN